MVLLTGAGLFLRSVQQASQIDLGYGSHNVFFNQIWIDKKRYSLTQANEFFLDLQTRIATLPEVQSVCLTEGPLLDDARYSGGQTITVYGTEQKPFGDRKIESFIVSPKFFETVGIPLAGGRDFTEQDRLTSGRVIVINEALARRAFPERNPIGQQLRLFPDMLYPNSEPLEIIGVAKDAKHHSLSEGTEPYLYRPIKDFYGYRGNYMGLFIRTHRNPATTLQAVAGLINNLDPEVTFKQSK